MLCVYSQKENKKIIIGFVLKQSILLDSSRERIYRNFSSLFFSAGISHNRFLWKCLKTIEMAHVLGENISYVLVFMHLHLRVKKTSCKTHHALYLTFLYTVNSVQKWCQSLKPENSIVS